MISMMACLSSCPKSHQMKINWQKTISRQEGSRAAQALTTIGFTAKTQTAELEARTNWPLTTEIRLTPVVILKLKNCWMSIWIWILQTESLIRFWAISRGSLRSRNNWNKCYSNKLIKFKLQETTDLSNCNQLEHQRKEQLQSILRSAKSQLALLSQEIDLLRVKNHRLMLH